MTGQTGKSIEEEIFDSIRRLGALSRRGPKRPCSGEAVSEGRGCGRGQLLGALADGGPMSQTKLAEVLDIRPQSLSEMIDKTEAEGLVQRQQSSEDRRRSIVSLTALGTERVDAYREAHRRRAEEFLSPLTKEEKSALSSLLARLEEGERKGCWEGSCSRPAEDKNNDEAPDRVTDGDGAENERRA